MLGVILLFGSGQIAFRLCKFLLQSLDLLLSGHIVHHRLVYGILQIALLFLE